MLEIVSAVKQAQGERRIVHRGNNQRCVCVRDVLIGNLAKFALLTSSALVVVVVPDALPGGAPATPDICRGAFYLARLQRQEHRHHKL